MGIPVLIRLLSRLVKDFTWIIHTYFSSSKTAPSVASETSADRPSDQFFPPRAKLLGPASSGRFRRTPPPVAKARESPLVKLDSSHDTLGWVVYITNRQVGYIHSCVCT